MSRLPRLLTTADLPAAELRALELDDELRRVGRRWSPRDVRAAPADRLTALGLDPSSRLIADRAAAAWVWGAAPAAPDPVTCCVMAVARSRPTVESGFTVREVVIDEREIIRTSGGAATSPLRTTIDLARLSPEWTAADDEVIRLLAQSGGFSASDAVEQIAPARRLAGSRRARSRISWALEGRAQPELTR